MTYTLQTGVVLVTICDENFLVAAGEARGKVPYIEGVTRPGAYFWRLLESHMDTDEIIQQAASDYNVPEETAKIAFDGFADSLQKKGYLVFGEVAP